MKKYAIGLLMVFALSFFLIQSPTKAWAKEDGNEKVQKEESADATDDSAPAKEEKKDVKAADKKSADKKSEDKKAEKKADAKKDKSKAEKKEKKKKEKKGPEVLKLKKKPFQINVEVKGTVEAKEMVPISITPDSWSKFEVLEAAEHGQRVRRGDLLVTFDSEDLDEAIADLQAELKVSEIDQKMAQTRLEGMRKLHPMNLEAAERSIRIAKEDRDYWFETGMNLQKTQMKVFLDYIASFVENARDELEQLEKMYAEDDLTEETEEIVLKRARKQLKIYEAFYNNMKTRFDRMVDIELPRRSERMDTQLSRILLEMGQRQITLPLELKLGELKMEKSDIQRTRKQEKLDQLLADRKLMTIKSPIDGILYYGKCSQGKWKESSYEAIQKGKNISSKKVFMTVVGTDSLQLRAAVEEKNLVHLRSGIKGHARATAFPQKRIDTVVDQVASIPANSKFDTTLTFVGEDLPKLSPGMTCTVKMVGYYQKEAIVIPESAVETDPLDDEIHFVFKQVDRDKKPEKVQVQLGQKNSDGVEVLSGLKAGETILKKCPKEEDESKEKKAK